MFMIDYEALAAEQETLISELVLPGSRRERIAYRTLKVVWPPERLLDDELPAIKDFMRAEYAKGIDTENPPSEAQMRAARAAVMVRFAWFRHQYQTLIVLASEENLDPKRDFHCRRLDVA